MSLREDLRPNQNIHPVFLNAFQYLLPDTLATHTVTIYTHDSRTGEALDQCSFHPLRAVAERGNVLVAAFGADGRKALPVATIVAAQFFFAQVNHQATGAAMTGRYPRA